MAGLMCGADYAHIVSGPRRRFSLLLFPTSPKTLAEGRFDFSHDPDRTFAFYPTFALVSILNEEDSPRHPNSRQNGSRDNDALKKFFHCPLRFRTVSLHFAAGHRQQHRKHHERNPHNMTERRFRTEAEYFARNAERMRYPKFRHHHLFIGSGVIEAGCRAVIGSRLKQSGMFWTVRGGNSIIALRCCHLNARFEDYWEKRRAA
jgi:hypothetical protein